MFSFHLSALYYLRVHLSNTVPSIKIETAIFGKTRLFLQTSVCDNTVARLERRYGCYMIMSGYCGGNHANCLYRVYREQMKSLNESEPMHIRKSI